MTTSAVIITGASRGIGRAVAGALAAADIPLGLIALDADRLSATAAEINETGGRVAWRAADVRDGGAVQVAVDELAAQLHTDFGAQIGLLLNNAGRIDREVPLWQADPTQWRDVMATNLLGSFHVSHAVIPHMLSAGAGRVIEMVSGAGAKDWGKASAYVASKAAAIRNVGHLHEAGYALGLRSFALSPGTVRTDMSTSMELHQGRTEFTPVELTIDLVLAVYRGELDEWSGKYLRATHDTPQSLAAQARKWAEQKPVPHHSPEPDHQNPVPPQARRLVIMPWGEDDPQLTEALVPKRG